MAFEGRAGVRQENRSCDHHRRTRQLAVSEVTRYAMKTVILAIALVFGQMAEGAQCTGTWAASGRSPYDLGKEGIAAPNGTRSVVGGDRGLLIVDQAGEVEVPVTVNPPLTEVVWAPGSRFFAVNASDGGLVGTWDAALVDSATAAIVARPLALVRKAASSLPNCEEFEQPNLAVTAWLRGGKEMLVVAEVPAHSSCRNMAAVVGFRVDATTGAIRERLSAWSLRRRWSAVLGCRFASLTACCSQAPSFTAVQLT